MKLRYKFGLLAALYISLLVCNFLLCAWCIVLYYGALPEEFGTAPARPGWSGGPESDTDEEELLREVPPPSAREIPQVSERRPATDDGPEALAFSVLLINAVMGAGLSLLGPLLVRKWVLMPVVDLRRAAQRIAAGDWSFRVRQRSHDELGLLTRELNETMGALVHLQEQLGERERQITTAEALRCVVHNIRSPLTGVRWLAEVIALRLAGNVEASARQNRIICIADEVIGWLGSLRQARSSRDHTGEEETREQKRVLSSPTSTEPPHG